MSSNLVFAALSVENLAYRRSITLNELAYPSPNPLRQTLLSYLIDGYAAPSRCTMIDSTRCRNNEPRILIDLNRNVHIHGVIIQQLDSCTYFARRAQIQPSSFF